MLKNPTVFIIGAGAGVDIDMPTGAQLIGQMAREVDFRFTHREMKSGNSTIFQGVRTAGARKNLDLDKLAVAGRNITQGLPYARSIDSYIHTHRDNEEIKTVGKVAIAKIILEKERQSKLFIDTTKGNAGFRDRDGVHRSWLNDFMYLLHEGVVASDKLDEIFGNIAIINFNYDRCVEHFLWKSIQDLFVVSADRARQLLSRARICHPYGIVAPLPWQNSEGMPYGGDPVGYDVDLAAFAENIRTFNEEVAVTRELQEAREWIRRATNLIFLGFHFHKQNMDIIRPVEPTKIASRRRAYASTFGRSDSDQEIIGDRITHLMSESSTGVTSSFVRSDCKALFVEYGTALLG